MATSGTSFARAVDGIPVVPNTTARDARFKNPEVDQRVQNRETGYIERWDGAQWVVDLAVLTNVDQQLEYFAARMAAGQTVNIACYGDSTTDGNLTTGWVANPTLGGEAVGNIDHEATAPNAWPAKLKALLREIHGNNNINVWNAGYSGQRMDNGWAYRNYDKAVTRNPSYGTPHVCLIGFGLNDIQDPGSQLANHEAETRKLLRKLLNAGTLPVLLTCDASFRSGSDIRDHKEASRQIDALKVALATEFQIPLIDLNGALKAWFASNADGYRWSDEQTDGLHFGDKGHAFKAGFAAKHFVRDLVTIDATRGSALRVPTWDSRTAYVGDYTTRYKYANTVQGANILYSSGAPQHTAMMTLWVWNESPRTELVYRGVDGEYYLQAGTANAPKVRVTEKIQGAVTTKTPAQVGFAHGGIARASDSPYRIMRLPYGLSKVEYLSGNSGSLFYGFFEFWQTKSLSEHNNALARVGLLKRDFTNSGIQVAYVEESPEGENAYGLCVGDSVEFLVDATLPKTCGVILGHGAGFPDGAAAQAYGTRTFWMVYRHDATEDLRVYLVRHNADGTFNFQQLGGATAALTWDPSNRRSFRVTLTRTGDTQVLTIYDTWTSGVALVTITTALATQPARFAGAAGGLYYNATVAGVAATGQLHQLYMRRY